MARPARTLFFALTGLLMFLSSGLASANSGDAGQMNARYPSFYSAWGCGSCHTASVPALKVYGTAYKTAVGGNRGNNSLMNAALASIEGGDADGDGRTNVFEINGGTTDPSSAS